MRLTISRLIAFSVLLSVSIVLLVRSGPNGRASIVTKAVAATRAGACPDGTVASYIGTSCSQEQLSSTGSPTLARVSPRAFAIRSGPMERI